MNWDEAEAVLVAVGCVMERFFESFVFTEVFALRMTRAWVWCGWGEDRR